MFRDGRETSTEDMATELVYRWERYFRKVGVEKALPELRFEVRRFLLSPEIIAATNPGPGEEVGQ